MDKCGEITVSKLSKMTAPRNRKTLDSNSTAARGKSNGVAKKVKVTKVVKVAAPVKRDEDDKKADMTASSTLIGRLLQSTIGTAR